jgi:hypothetical protein
VNVKVRPNPRIASGRMLPNWVVASAEMLPQANQSVRVQSTPTSGVFDVRLAFADYDQIGGRQERLERGESSVTSVMRQSVTKLREATRGEEKRKMLGRRVPPSPVTDFDTFDVEVLANATEHKDSSVPNGSSIAFVAEYGGRSVLFTGDAHADVLTRSIAAFQRQRGRLGEPLVLDALKLSHHGSRNATTVELLKSIECPRYLVPTNGIIFYHPDREAIARIIKHGGERPTIYFNYRSDYNQLWEDERLRDRYQYDTVYPDGGCEGLRVSL